MQPFQNRMVSVMTEIGGRWRRYKRENVDGRYLYLGQIRTVGRLVATALLLFRISHLAFSNEIIETREFVYCYSTERALIGFVLTTNVPNYIFTTRTVLYVKSKCLVKVQLVFTLGKIFFIFWKFCGFE